MISMRPFVSGLLAGSPFLLTVCASASGVEVDPSAEALRAAAPLAPAPGDDVEPHGGMLRYPDVSATHIAFVYADDLWVVPREGGVASPLASPPGLESLPRFSPDGKTIAFMGNYDGNRDIYTLPIVGGVPTRVTHHPGNEVLCGWTSDGQLLFFTNGLAGRDRQVQLFKVGAEGGLPEKLPVPYGAFADISADGQNLAYTPHTADNRTWKRYRGGMATDIWLYDLVGNGAQRVTDWEGTDTAPMWHERNLYYLSDDGPSHRLNLWMVEPKKLERRQLTKYDDFDVKWPSNGPGPSGTGEIVFQHGSDLVLYDIASGESHPVSVTIPGARAKQKARTVDAAKFVQNWDISPSGKRVIASARGDVWSLPAKDGSPRNLTRTSGVAERDGTWSPDGKWIAWLSDASGEYELVVALADGKGEPRTLTSGGKAYRHLMSWSPDSKYLAFCDKTGTLYLQPAEGGETRKVAQDVWQGDLWGVPPSFSHDGRFLAMALSDEVSSLNRIAIHEIETGETRLVTSGMFDDSWPTFDRKGDYLYFRRQGHFDPLYSDLDTTFIYAGAQMLCLVPLRGDQASPFAPESDEEEPEAADEKKKDDDEDDDDDEKKKDEEKDGKEDESGKEDDAKDELAKAGDESGDDAGDDEKEDEEEDEGKPREKVEIAFEGFERRAVPLPIDPGNFGTLAVNSDGALVYIRRGVPGSDDEPSIHVFDVEADEPEEELVAKEVGNFGISADGKKLIVLKEGGAEIGDAKAEAEFEKVPTDGMLAQIDPREEWRQLFADAWRIYRDFFYDPDMHHVDWPAMRSQYAAMLEDCTSREDLSYVIKELISELNVGHAYYSGGDVGDEPRSTVGLLGCDFALENGAYAIAKIHEGAPWDADARGPLSQPGNGVKEGEYLLAVNGVPLDVTRDPWAAFQGLADKIVTLTVSSLPTLDASARTVVVKTLSSERDVRYRSWVEVSRKKVDEATQGRVGYVYVPSTGIDGQNDLVRQLQGQMRKEALIVDERWNSGGQIPTRFIEILNRPVTNYFARRDGKDWPWPPDAHQGPKCMLINGLSGSGGDAFPWYFRQAKLGKLIGTRTWGGLVGLSGYPALIDGGDVEVPSFAFYESDGTWGVEGHGVDPDIEVIDDPSLMADGGDPQLDRAIELMLQELKERPYVAPGRPTYPDRSGMGLPESDR